MCGSIRARRLHEASRLLGSTTQQTSSPSRDDSKSRKSTATARRTLASQSHSLMRFTGIKRILEHTVRDNIQRTQQRHHSARTLLNNLRRSFKVIQEQNYGWRDVLYTHAATHVFYSLVSCRRRATIFFKISETSHHSTLAHHIFHRHGHYKHPLMSAFQVYKHILRRTMGGNASSGVEPAAMSRTSAVVRYLQDRVFFLVYFSWRVRYEYEQG